MGFLRRRLWTLALAATLACSCSRPDPAPAKLTVAAASNLMGVFDEITGDFQKQTGIEVTLSYGSTAQLAKQIENGAPFDVFAAADKEHIAQLADNGHVIASSTAVYARGQLALWIPDGDQLGVHSLQDLTHPEVRFIAIAQPDLAPYGTAAVEALKASGLWKELEPKVVYAINIGMARQFAASGNANAAFTAQSLVQEDPGVIVKVDPSLHTPIDQAVGVVSSSAHPDLGRKFAQFLAGPEARALLRAHAYTIP